MVKMPRFETYCLETGFKTLVTETGQQLPPSIDYLKEAFTKKQICYNTPTTSMNGMVQISRRDQNLNIYSFSKIK